MRISLNEGKRDEALGMFLPLFQKRGIETNISQLKQFLLNKFVTEAGIHSLSQGSNFYLLGVARYYFNGDLTRNVKLNALYPNFKDKFIPEVCQKLDALVNILRGMYIDTVGQKWEQPEDFGNLTLQALFKKYNRIINKALGLDVPAVQKEPEKKEKVSQSYKSGRKYTYDILYSFDDAKKYKNYTEPGAWCITYGKQHYDGYIKMLNIHYVIFRQNGFENIPRRKGKNFTKQKPQDEYGNSLIAVLQSNKNGEPVYITSRWNHGSRSDNSECEADHAYTKEEFFNITGCNDEILQRAFKQWQAGVKERGGADQKVPIDRKEAYAQKLDILRTFKYAQMMINGGANIRDYIQGGRVIREGKNYKGTYLVYITKDRESYYTIMDRKKMFYDQYLIHSEYANLIINTTDTYCLLRDDDRKYFYLFDLIHHQFINLDGCYKFKALNSELEYSRGDGNNGIKWAVIAQSGNQIGLLNLQTMKPIKAPNGSCWFEAITAMGSGYGNSNSNRDYQGHIKLPSYLDRSTVLKMVYDSSAREVYLFDTMKGQFIQTRNNEDGFILSEWQDKAKLGFLRYVNGDDRSSEKLIRFQRLSNNEWFNVGGYNTFKAIEWNEALVIGYKGYDEDVTHYIDGKTGKYLEIQGQPITTYNPEMNITSNWLAISISRTKTDWDFWAKCVFFNPITRTIYHDNISGWYFKVYGSQGPIVYYPNSKEKYKLPSPQEVTKQVEQSKEDIKNNFNNMINRMEKA